MFDLFALQSAFLGACGGLLVATAVYLIEEARGVLWRRIAAAAFLVLGVLALILAVIS